MQKSKIDRILEWVESIISKQAGTNDSNIDLSQQDNNSITTVSDNTENDNEVIENNEWVATEEVEQPQQEQQVIVEQTTPIQDTTVEESSTQQWDDFESIYNELMSSLQKKEDTQQNNVDNSSSVNTNQEVDTTNYKELYEQERQKNLLLEWEKKDLTWQATYFKNSLDKEWEKQRELMDKIKDLEAELRTVNAKSIPEQFVPLTQTYNLRQETKIPAHKWRAVKEALTVVENLTWVPASDYYNQIIKNESPDIPEVNDHSSTTSKLQQNKQFSNGFVML